MIAYHVYITTKVSEYVYDLEIKDQKQIFLKLATLLIIQIPLWCIYGMCSYLEQLLRMMCRLKRRFQIADMTLYQRSRTNIPVKMLEIQISSSFILTEGVQSAQLFAYHVLIATDVSEYIFDLKVKVQIQIYLKNLSYGS